jgi:hypothetical protein
VLGQRAIQLCRNICIVHIGDQTASLFGLKEKRFYKKPNREKKTVDSKVGRVPKSSAGVIRKKGEKKAPVYGHQEVLTTRVRSAYQSNAEPQDSRP